MLFLDKVIWQKSPTEDLSKVAIKYKLTPWIQRWTRNSMKQTLNPVSEADPTTQESQRKTLKFQNRIV